MNKPSKSLYRGFRDSNVVTQDVLAWFDDIYECFVEKRINRELAKFASYKTVEPAYVDYFLYDKGFSTHPNLSYAAKISVLDNWKEIYNYRFTTKGIKSYMDSLSQQATTVTITLDSARKDFIQPNNTLFGFPNQAMIDSIGTSTDNMTYLYSTDYTYTDTIQINFPVLDVYLDSIKEYLIGLLEFELPRVNDSQKWKVILYNVDTSSTILEKTI